MTPEGQLKKDIKAYLKSRGIYWAIVPEGAYGKSGDPDLIACYKGLFVGLEVKAFGGRQRDFQKVRQREIEASGGVYALVRSVEDVELALEKAVTNSRRRRKAQDYEEDGEDTVFS